MAVFCTWAADCSSARLVARPPNAKPPNNALNQLIHALKCATFTILRSVAIICQDLASRSAARSVPDDATALEPSAIVICHPRQQSFNPKPALQLPLSS